MQEKGIAHITVGDIATNCWMYPLAEHELPAATPAGFSPCALIDPGAEAERIIARLDNLNLVPVYILLTHGHFDHIAALPAIAAHYRRDGRQYPRIAIHADDAGYLGSGSYAEHCRCFAAAGGSSAYIDAYWEEMPLPDQTLAEGTVIGPFTVLHVPGHTRGSIALWDKNTETLFSGDTLFFGAYGRTDLPGGSEADLFKSLERLLALDTEITVYPGHGPATTIGREAAEMMR
jgi:glyoxylase-like metal-dependent hydrolase (beta-lactamase superfamily II)